jgi:hypothetical protein
MPEKTLLFSVVITSGISSSCAISTSSSAVILDSTSFEFQQMIACNIPESPETVTLLERTKPVLGDPLASNLRSWLWLVVLLSCDLAIDNMWKVAWAVRNSYCKCGGEENWRWPVTDNWQKRQQQLLDVDHGVCSSWGRCWIIIIFRLWPMRKKFHHQNNGFFDQSFGRSAV